MKGKFELGKIVATAAIDERMQLYSCSKQQVHGIAIFSNTFRLLVQHWLRYAFLHL